VTDKKDKDKDKEKDKKKKDGEPKAKEEAKPKQEVKPSFAGLDPSQVRQAKEFKYTVPLLACRYDPTGSFLFTASQDNLIERWEIASGKKTDFSGHSSWVRAIAFEPKGKLMVTGGYDGQILLWNREVNDPVPMRQVQAHQGWVRSLSVDSGGGLLASSGNDGKIALWNLKDLKSVKSWQAHDDHVYQVGIHPKEKALVSVDLKGKVRFWDFEGKMLREGDAKSLHKYDTGFGADIGGARSMAFSPDGSKIALAGITNVSNAFAGVGNPIVLVLEWATGKVLNTLSSKEKFQGTMWGVSWHSAGFIAACAGGNGGMLWFFQPDQPNEFALLKLPENARDISLHPDGKSLAIPYAGGAVRTYDITPKG